jgi:hypothetical protein
VSNSSNKTYIGQYTDFKINDSEDWTKYKWTYFKGEQGERGIPGVGAYHLELTNEIILIPTDADGDLLAGEKDTNDDGSTIDEINAFLKTVTEFTVATYAGGTLITPSVVTFELDEVA